jgi:hypothetical protein
MDQVRWLFIELVFLFKTTIGQAFKSKITKIMLGM